MYHGRQSVNEQWLVWHSMLLNTHFRFGDNRSCSQPHRKLRRRGKRFSRLAQFVEVTELMSFVEDERSDFAIEQLASFIGIREDFAIVVDAPGRIK